MILDLDPSDTQSRLNAVSSRSARPCGCPARYVEPHVMTNYGGRLMPDYSTGQLEFNGLAKAYGIPVEPFVFVVDAQGRIAASFELIVGSDEIRAAIRAAQGARG
jgi:hypothetical protein